MIAAGGTAGHVVPALAVADALRARGAEVEFIGGERAEAELVPAAGYPFHALRVSGLDRQQPAPRRARRPAARGRATLRARKLLRELGADARAGRRRLRGRARWASRRAALRLPLVLTEADSHLGVTNRLLAPLADRVFLAFPIEGRGGAKWVVSGRPVPAGTGSADRAAARARFGIGPDEPCVLVFGGSLGARRINDAALRRLRRRRPVRGAARERARATTTSLRARLDAIGSPAALPPARRTSSRSPTRSPPPTWRWPAPAAR